MAEYVKDFENGYKIQKVFANEWEDTYGDVYDFKSDVEKEHPGTKILEGYVVIDEAAGLIPNGCNDWNETVEKAMQDYEEHVVPVLDEDIELKDNILGENREVISEVSFTVKSSWLQNYFSVDNKTQLEALLLNSDSWEPADIFNDAKSEPDLSGFVRKDTNFDPYKQLTPYRIRIEETYVKEVEVYAEDALSAQQIAEDLCSAGVIDIDYDNFTERSTECYGEARLSDLELHEVYGENGPVDKSDLYSRTADSKEKRQSLSNLISSAEQKTQGVSEHKNKQTENER